MFVRLLHILTSTLHSTRSLSYTHTHTHTQTSKEKRKENQALVYFCGPDLTHGIEIDKIYTDICLVYLYNNLIFFLQFFMNTS